MPYLRILVLFVLWPLQALALPIDNTQRAVWANEAIITTFTYNYENFLPRQKEIAQYFTADGWIAYSKALLNAKLSESVISNKYDVSAVATMPPVIKHLSDNKWQATMPVLVVYKNSEYTQKQTLDITLNFIESTGTIGIRGFAITSMQSSVAIAPCRCSGPAKTRAVAWA